MALDKKAAAVEFLNKISGMEPAALNDLIVQSAGVELAEFFAAYGNHVVGTSPERAVDAASSLLLMGYLIRCNEERLAEARA